MLNNRRTFYTLSGGIARKSRKYVKNTMKNSNRLRVKHFVGPMFQFWWISCLERRRNMQFCTSISVHAWSVRCIQLFAILRTVACQAPLSEISQAKTLEWVTIPFSKGSSRPRDRTHVSYIGRWILYHWVTWEVLLLSICFPNFSTNMKSWL